MIGGGLIDGVPISGVLSNRRSLVVGLLSLGLAACGEGPPSPEAPRTLVVVTIDGLELPDGEPGGRIPADMTRLQSWAESGIVFDPCVSASESTQATLASLWTGLDPDRHGVISVHLPGRRRLRASAETLAEYLRAAGWETRSALALPQLSAGMSGLDQGFAHHLAPTTKVSKGAWSAEELLDRSRPEIEEALGGDRPVFLWVHLADARVRPADDDPDLIAALERELEPLRDNEHVARWFDRSDFEEREATEQLRRSLGRSSRGGEARRALERAEARTRRVQVDRALDVLAQWVSEAGRSERAHWLVLGTRGSRRSEGHEAIWESSQRAVERSLVTCVGAGGAFSSAAVAPDLMRTVDLFPTLADALGLSVPSGLDGLPWRELGERRARVRGAARGGTLAVTVGGARAFPAWGLGPPGGTVDSVSLGKGESATPVPESVDFELRTWGASKADLQTVEIALVAAGGAASVPLDLRSRRSTWASTDGDMAEPFERSIGGLDGVDTGRRIHWADEPPDLRLTLGSRDEPVDAARLLVGSRRHPYALPYVFFESGEAWPEPQGGQAPPEPRVDVVQGQGRRLRVEVTADADSEVEVLLLGWSDGLVDESLDVEVPTDARGVVEVETLPGRPDGRRVRGTGALSFSFERAPQVQPVLGVRIDGESLDPSTFRYRGKRIFPAGRVSVLLPARLPSLTEPLRSGETPPSEGELPNDVPDGSVVLRWWGRTPLAPTRDSLSEDERRFLARLPEDE